MPHLYFFKLKTAHKGSQNQLITSRISQRKDVTSNLLISYGSHRLEKFSISFQIKSICWNKVKDYLQESLKANFEPALMSRPLSQSSGNRPGYAPDAELLIVGPVPSLGNFSGNQVHQAFKTSTF